METTLRVFDVREKEVGQAKAPSFPAPIESTTGFPEHKRRSKTSAFKQRKQAEKSTCASPSTVSASNVAEDPRDENCTNFGRDAASGPSPSGLSADDSRKIDRENKERINNMSSKEIQEAQDEIFNSFDPSLIQRLLMRANLDEAGPASLDASSIDNGQGPYPDTQVQASSISVENAGKSEDVTPATHSDPAPKRVNRPKKTVTFEDGAAPQAALPLPTTTNTTHFPQQTVPDLDPNDPDFLETLHKKFFPNLPADPSKLAWMAPLPTPNSTADRESPYYPGQDSLPVSALRFDFHGKLVPPRLSRQIPVTMGLHHHGQAPEAAGYTIPELARLARSAVPGQRCIAFQTLGRMLFRLGNGEWGIGEGGRAGEEDDLAFGLWRCFLETRVLDSLSEAASVEDGAGHMASKAYAVEALWLFEKGGWREKWRGM